jgi:hypothetical protein
MLIDSKIFFATGAALVGVGLLSFVGVVILKVATGHSLAAYNFINVVPVTYVATFATILFALGVMIFAGALRLIDWYRQRRGMPSSVTSNNRWRGR